TLENGIRILGGPIRVDERFTIVVLRVGENHQVLLGLRRGEQAVRSATILLENALEESIRFAKTLCGLVKLAEVWMRRHPLYLGQRDVAVGKLQREVAILASLASERVEV